METLKSDVKTCKVFKIGEVKSTARSDNKESFVIYGRNGVRNGVHLESRCNNKNKYSNCRTGYFHGYLVTNGITVFEDNALKNEVLVTSNQTGFEIEYLIELKDRIQLSNITFEAEAKTYNRYHNRNLPFDTLQKRIEINQKRTGDVYCLYICLESGQ